MLFLMYCFSEKIQGEKNVKKENIKMTYSKWRANPVAITYFN